MTRFPLLILAGLAAALVWPPVIAAVEDGPSPDKPLTILHTNDIHGHLLPWRGWEGDLAGKTLGGMDRLGGAIKQVREEVGRENVILLDAGDMLGDSLVADQTQGKAIIDAMNVLNYTAMVIGNHELDFTADTLKKRIAEAEFPVLAANITEKVTGRLFTLPYLIQEIRGVKVGVLGLAYPNTPLTTAKKNVDGLEFGEAPEVAREYVPRLREQGAQVVVVLSHYGLAADKILAKQVPGIDVIVGGHSHNRMKDALREGNTLIVQAGAHGSDLGRLDLKVKNGKIIRYAHSLITLDHAVIPSDAQVASIVRRAASSNKTKLEERLGQAVSPIARAQTIAGQEAQKRDQESPADSLFADLIRERTRVDAVILPGVGYGTAIPAGTIQAGALRNLIPHESKTVTMTLTGAQIREILEQSLENTYTDDPKKKVGGLVQVSGIHFKYNAEDSHPHRLAEVRVQGKRLDRKRDYRVATNSLLAGGGHNYKAFLQGKNIQEGQTQYELVKVAIQQREKLHAPEPGRIENFSRPVNSEAAEETDRIGHRGARGLAAPEAGIRDR
jgi:2',3'-cyclic-nucleotide 2'-phosphodiesterase (5'-nucleotidase family)